MNEAERCAQIAETIAEGYHVTDADALPAQLFAIMRAAEYGARRVAESIRQEFPPAAQQQLTTPAERAAQLIRSMHQNEE